LVEIEKRIYQFLFNCILTGDTYSRKYFGKESIKRKTRASAPIYSLDAGRRKSPHLLFNVGNKLTVHSMEKDFKDEDWEEGIYGYGPQYETCSDSFPDWKTVSFSWQYGVWDNLLYIHISPKPL